LIVLFLLYKLLVMVVSRARMWLFPTQHELELRLEKTLAKEEELETKKELKEKILASSKRSKALEDDLSKIDAEMESVYCKK